MSRNAYVEKKGRYWRVCKSGTDRLFKKGGGPVDDGGYLEKNRALAHAQAISMGIDPPKFKEAKVDGDSDER